MNVSRRVRYAVAAFVAFVLAASGVSAAQAATRAECRTVRVLESAGFSGNQVRIAYAIVMRESRGQNLDESSPWYTGALGMWQIQTSAWAGKHWWSRSAMLDRKRQSRIVWRYMSNRGTYWAHWGISRDGRGMDTTYYSGWSAAQQYAWIWAPYKRFYDAFPACRV